jgi:hypothetical protein
MASPIKVFWVSAALLAAVAGAAIAQQPMMSDCEKWVARIKGEAEMRFDDASYSAKMQAEEIAKMCKAGKTAEAEKAAKDTMAKLGIRP